MTKPPTPTAHEANLSYAAQLLLGAVRISRTAATKDIGEIGIPFYLLIGFAIENGLKGFLKHRQDAGGNWRKSHDLSLLLSHCRENGLRVNEAVDRLIHLISRYHAEFWFRHPEKAGTADVFDAHSTIFLTDALLRQAFEQTNTSWRHWPKMPPPQSPSEE